jgi:hypothetical protein
MGVIEDVKKQMNRFKAKNWWINDSNCYDAMEQARSWVNL